MKKILFLALGCSLLFTPSCKDFLQKENPNSPTEAIFWQSKNDFDLALTGIYSQMRGGIYYRQSPNVASNFLTTFLATFDNFTDNTDGGTYNYAGQNEFLRDNITPENMPGLIGSAYDYCYAAIARINIFLGHLEEMYSDKTNADYKQFKGEALALRGLMYHYLYTCYGAVPIVKEALVVENMYMEKSSAEDVYKSIIGDYTEAISLLPKGQNYMANPGHITGDAVIALRARTRLYHAYDANGTANKTEMAEILTELNTITAAYSLAEDVLDNFHTSTQSACPEIMFSLRFLKPDMRNQIDLFIGSWKMISPTRSLVLSFPNADGTAYVPAGDIATKATITDAEMTALFTGRDPRLAAFIAPNGVYNFDGYVGDAIDFTDGDTPNTQFAVRKLVTPLSGQSGNNSWDDGYTWQGDQDVVLLRWAHVLLMKAEAAFESGDVAGAEGYIKELRDRYNMPAITGLTQELLRNEIRIETCFEGQRYFDMKRWRILSDMNGKKQDPNSSITVVVNPNHFDWPIPWDEIEKAKNNGVTLTQNPGYNNPTGN
ncbi:MAG: RagB/SusD family nutrient uptake outer membrane protein [Rikenellaceae bacterium]|nr:RagB/SusD family nutrient uptake outer membrane protein [Rikenellaceae bacterium]